MCQVMQRCRTGCAQCSFARSCTRGQKWSARVTRLTSRQTQRETGELKQIAPATSRVDTHQAARYYSRVARVSCVAAKKQHCKSAAKERIAQHVLLIGVFLGPALLIITMSAMRRHVPAPRVLSRALIIPRMSCRAVFASSPRSSRAASSFVKNITARTRCAPKTISRAQPRLVVKSGSKVIIFHSRDSLFSRNALLSRAALMNTKQDEDARRWQ